MPRDYYEVLGISRDADAEAIKDAFRGLALKYHPDRNKSPDAEARFKEIAEAYAVLSDPRKRAEYDARGFSAVEGFTPEDLFGGIDFGDIFGDLGFGLDFGLGAGGLFDRLFRHRPAGPARGEDLQLALALPLETVLHGGEETVRYARSVACERCRGSGAEPGTAPRACAGCGGTGRKVIARGEQRGEATVQLREIIVCPECAGRGTIIDKRCRECGGEGRVEREERLTLAIPPGIEEGAALRVPGHGGASPEPGGPAGDLYCVVTNLPDERFTRAGADLWRIQRIDVVEAVLGTELEVPTLEGAVTVKVPPGTQPGATLRLREKGLPVYGERRRGDLNLRMEVRVPEQLTVEERDCYERLRALRRTHRGRGASRSRGGGH